MAKPKPPPRKRGRPPTSPPGTVETRIREIMRRMARFAYDPEELAAEWDLSVGTVQNYASEASRRVKAIVENDDEIRGILKFALIDLVRDCRSGKRPDRRTAVEALRVLAGVVAVKKERLVGDDDGPPRFIVELSEPMRPGQQPPATPIESAPPDGAPLEVPAEPQAP